MITEKGCCADWCGSLFRPVRGLLQINLPAYIMAVYGHYICGLFLCGRRGSEIEYEMRFILPQRKRLRM